jgi:hypothetical protein
VTSDIEGTLRFVVPGFVALKLFYVFGLRTRRTDLELTLWSVLVAAVINAFVERLTPPDVATRLALALVSAATGAGVAVAAWRMIVRRRPQTAAGISPRAWDAILGVPHWVQIWTTSGRVIHGRPRIVSESVETDTLDLYLEEVAWVDVERRQRIPMDGAAGVLVAESSIDFIQVLADEEVRNGFEDRDQ